MVFKESLYYLVLKPLAQEGVVREPVTGEEGGGGAPSGSSKTTMDAS